VPSVLVFVYGSLKRGFRHHAVLGAAQLVREASTAPGYRLVRYGEYPALAPDPGGSERVYGELYWVELSDLPRLDGFEDVPELYQRGEVTLDGGERAEAYLISAQVAARHPPVPFGKWEERF
jgi:gamma-glutamylcyclotransferase (GGCT)/AIG2-like uncharacterized protein YtfP